jgi:hypothetical protein
MLITQTEMTTAYPIDHECTVLASPTPTALQNKAQGWRSLPWEQVPFHPTILKGLQKSLALNPTRTS